LIHASSLSQNRGVNRSEKYSFWPVPPAYRS
jgi:hypothetical protein